MISMCHYEWFAWLLLIILTPSFAAIRIGTVLRSNLRTYTHSHTFELTCLHTYIIADIQTNRHTCIYIHVHIQFYLDITKQRQYLKKHNIIIWLYVSAWATHIIEVCVCVFVRRTSCTTVGSTFCVVILSFMLFAWSVACSDLFGWSWCLQQNESATIVCIPSFVVFTVLVSHVCPWFCICCAERSDRTPNVPSAPGCKSSTAIGKFWYKKSRHESLVTFLNQCWYHTSSLWVPTDHHHDYEFAIITIIHPSLVLIHHEPLSTIISHKIP